MSKTIQCVQFNHKNKEHLQGFIAEFTKYWNNKKSESEFINNFYYFLRNAYNLESSKSNITAVFKTIVNKFNLPNKEVIIKDFIDKYDSYLEPEIELDNINSDSKEILPSDLEEVNPFSRLSFTQILKKFPSLYTYFEISTTNDFLESSIINFEEGFIVNSNETLNETLALLKNKYYKQLSNKFNAISLSLFTQNDEGDYIVSDKNEFTKTMKIAGDYFKNEDVIKELDRIITGGNIDDDIKAFIAYIVLSEDNFHLLLSKNLGKRVQIKSKNILATNNYKLVNEKHKSAIFGDSALANAKHGNVGKLLIESTPKGVYVEENDELIWREVPNQKINLDQFINFFDALKGKINLERIKEIKINDLRNNPINTLISAHKLLRDGLDYTDKVTFDSFYHQFLDPNNPLSLLNIQKNNDKDQGCILGYDYLQEVVQIGLRSDRVEYLTTNGDDPTYIQTGTALRERLAFTDVVETSIRLDSLTNYPLIKEKFSIDIPNARTIKFKINSKTIELTPNLNYEFPIKNINKAFENLPGYETIPGDILDIKEDSDLYALLEFIDSALPGSNFLLDNYNVLVALQDLGKLWETIIPIAYVGIIAQKFTYDALSSDDSLLNYWNNNKANYSKIVSIDSDTDTVNIYTKIFSGKLYDIGNAFKRAKNKVYKNVSDSFGNKLPTARNFSVAANFKYFLNKIKENPNNPISHFFIMNHTKELLGRVIFQDVNNGLGDTKQIVDLNEGELNYFNFVTNFLSGYIDSLKEEEGPSINILSTVYADKTTISYDRIPLKFGRGEEAIDFTTKNVEEIYELYRNNSLIFYQNIYNKIKNTYIQIFKYNKNGSYFFKDRINQLNQDELFKKNHPDLLSKLTKIDFDNDSSIEENLPILLNIIYLNNNGINEFENIAWELGLDSISELSYMKGSKIITSSGTFIGLKFNDLLLDYVNLYTNFHKFDNRLIREKNKFVKDLINSGFVLKKDNQVLSDIISTKKIDLSEWIHPITSELIIAKYGDKIITDTENIDLNNDNIILNPLLDRYFAINLLFSFEFRVGLAGTELAHPPKNMGISKDGQHQSEFNQSARELAQYKRESIHNTPMIPIAQGDIRTLPAKIKQAVMPDMKAPVYTVNGQNSSVDSQDGGDLMNPLTVILINLGLQSSSAGETLKGILHDQHSSYLGTIFFKYASFGQMNEQLRESQTATVNMLDMFRRMTNLSWEGYDINLSRNFYGERLTLSDITGGEFIYYKKGHKIYRIHNIKYNEEGKNYIILTQKVDPITGEWIDSQESKSININSIWDLYNALGGAYTGNFKDGYFKYDDSSLYAVVGYMNSVGSIVPKTENDYRTQYNTNQPLKQLFIASTINASCVKCGASHINDMSAWTKGPLKTMEVNTAGWGVVQDYDHVVTDGHSTLTEMSQVISAIMSGNKLYPLNKEVYESIAGVSLASIQEMINAVEQYIETKDDKAKSELYDIIGRYLIQDLENQSIQNAFLSELNDAFKYNSLRGIQRHNEDSFKLPISDPSLFAKYVTVIGSTVNKIAIKRSYPGGGLIMAPAYNIRMLHHIPGKHPMTFTDCFNRAISAEITSSQIIVDSKPIFSINENNELVYIEGNNEDIMISLLSYLEYYPDKKFSVKLFNGNKVLEELTKKGFITIDLNGLISKGNINFSNADLARLFLKSVEFDQIINDISQLMLEDTIILCDKSGNFVDISDTGELIRVEKAVRITVDTFNKHKYSYKQLKNTENLNFKYDVRTPRNLQPCKITFKIGTKQHSIYDIDAVQNAFDSTTLSEFEKKKAIDEALNNLSLGKVIINNKEDENVTDVNVEDYEAILPKLFKEQFNLREGDSVYDILTKGPEFFKQRFTNTHKPTIDSYDICLTKNNGKHTYITLDSNESNNVDIIDTMLLITIDNLQWKVDSKGNLQYPVRIAKTDSEGNISKNENGEIIWENYILPIVTDSSTITKYWCKDISAIQYLYNDTKFDSIIVKNSDIIQDVKQVLNIEINEVYNGNLAYLKTPNFNAQYNSFKKSLEVLVSRIPAQTLQSFMKMKVVGFSDTEKNIIYVSHYQIYLQGSDYDIDKAYTMAYGFDDNGLFVKWSPYFNLDTEEAFEESLQLPIPSSLDIIEDQNGINISKEQQQYLENNSITNLVILLNKINDGTQTITNEKGTSVRCHVVQSINPEIKEIVDKHNKYFSNLHSKKLNPNLPSKDDIMTSYKNLIANRLMIVASDIVNLASAQTPVSFGKSSELAESSPLGEIIKQSTSWSPSTRSRIQTIFADGKAGIGVAANGEKVYFNLIYYYISKIIEGVKKNDEEILNSVLFDQTLILNGKEFRKFIIANINLKFIKGIDTELLAECRNRIIELIESKLSSGKNISSNDIINLGFQEDQALVISALLSAATDNAKEFILGRINANPNYMNMYLYAVILGIDFEDIAKFMTSDTVTELIKLETTNIFTNPNTVKIDRLKDEFPPVNFRNIAQYIDVSKAELEQEKVKTAEEYLRKLFIGKRLNLIHIPTLEEILKLEYTSEQLKLYNNIQDLYKYYKLWKTENFKQNLETFKQLRKGGAEITNLARFLSANQGFGVTIEDKLNNLISLENIIREQLEKTEYADFDLLRFLNPSETLYRKEILKATNETKHTINILDVVMTLPNFKVLYDIRYITHQSDIIMTDKFKKLYDLKKSISVYNWKKDRYKGLEETVDDYYIFQWLIDKNISFPIKNLEKIIRHKSFIDNDISNLVINTEDNIATFKYWFESYLLPKLKEAYPKNYFIKSFRITLARNSFAGANYRLATLPINFKESDSDSFSPERIKYNKVVEAMKDLQGKEFENKPILDWIFLYSLITTKGKDFPNSVSNVFNRVSGLSKLCTEYYNSKGSRDYDLNEYIIDYALDDFIIGSAPVLTGVNQIKSSNEKYIRKKPGQRGKGYYLYQKIGGFSEFDDIDDMSDIGDDFSRIGNYTIVKNLADPVSLNYYTLNIHNYSRNLLELVIKDTDSIEDITRKLNNLIKHNILNIFIDCQ